jgi:endonuclease/exonuclease/phosphatase family metal-dependent hydrolase
MHTHRYERYKSKTLRNAMACLVRLPDDSLIWIVNTHLGCHFIGREQKQQANELVSFIHSLDRTKVRRLVVCGDFNSPPLYSCIQYMKKNGFRDVWEWFGHGWGGTFPSESRVLGLPFCVRKLLRLDYIFVLDFDGVSIGCDCVHVQDTGGECMLASDHLPLCASLIVR